MLKRVLFILTIQVFFLSDNGVVVVRVEIFFAPSIADKTGSLLGLRAAC